MSDVAARPRAPVAGHTWIGRSVPRLEDERLLRGRGRFVDDGWADGAGHMAVARCPFPHAEIVEIDASAALELDGVLAVLTGADVRARTRPLPILRPIPDAANLPFYAMAVDRALYEGHPVATVVARDRATAEDAIDRIDVEYEPLPHVVDAELALADGAPLLWDGLGSNLVATTVRETGEPDRAFDEAAVTVGDRFVINRVIGLPMEGRAILADGRAGDGLDVTASTQTPHLVRMQLAASLGIPETRIRVRAGDVGGGFGLKLGIYPEDVLACLHALDLRRPVTWVEDRLEHFRASTHARESVHEARIAVDGAGTLQAIRDVYHVDMGAYHASFGPPFLSSLMLPGPYRLRSGHIDRRVVATNKPPVGAYRGYGQPESNFVREVLVDRAARSLGMDPVAVRRRNLLRPEDMPWHSVGGAVYDSGDYLGPLEAALERVDYDGLRASGRQTGDGRLRGLGTASFVELTGYPGSASIGAQGGTFGAHEGVTLRANRAGAIEISTGVSSFGQGTETAFAQICADVVGVPLADVAVHAGDTMGTPQSTGSFASRTTIAGGGAILAAGGELRAKALRVGAHLLGVDPLEVELVDGVVAHVDDPDTSVSFREVAVAAITGHRLPPGEAPGLESTRYFDPPASAYGNGSAVAVVHLDPESGELEIARFVLAHDCGRQVNPKLVEGQILGGLAQGFGAAFLEELRYDRESGQLLNGTLVDYLVPTAADLPEFEVIHVDVPSPVTPLEVRGVGEAGTIPVAAAVANAICDAMAPARVEINRLPLSAENVWRAIESSRSRPPWGRGAS